MIIVLDNFVLDNFVALLYKIIKVCWKLFVDFWKCFLTILNEDKLTVKTCDGN